MPQIDPETVARGQAVRLGGAEDSRQGVIPPPLRPTGRTSTATQPPRDALSDRRGSDETTTDPTPQPSTDSPTAASTAARGPEPRPSLDPRERRGSFVVVGRVRLHPLGRDGNGHLHSLHLCRQGCPRRGGRSSFTSSSTHRKERLYGILPLAFGQLDQCLDHRFPSPFRGR